MLALQQMVSVHLPARSRSSPARFTGCLWIIYASSVDTNVRAVLRYAMFRPYHYGPPESDPMIARLCLPQFLDLPSTFLDLP